MFYRLIHALALRLFWQTQVMNGAQTVNDWDLRHISNTVAFLEFDPLWLKPFSEKSDSAVTGTYGMTIIELVRYSAVNAFCNTSG